MANIKVFDMTGKETGTLELLDSVFGIEPNTVVMHEAVKAYLASGRKVDAFFGRNDKLACLAMNACQEAGLAVPQDIAIIGFDMRV